MLETYQPLGGEHAETSALRNMLAFHGVTAPHSGEPFSEAMLLGIGGGVGGGYWVFEFKERAPVVVVGARHGWQESPGLFIRQVCDRLGIPATVQETTGRKGAEKQLREALEAGSPAAVAVDMASLPHLQMPDHLIKHLYHLVVVYGLDDDAGTALLDDRARTPFTLTQSELADARQAITSMKHRLVTVAPPSGSIDLAAAVEAGIRVCADGLLNPPIRNFGAAAWEKWAKQIANPKDKKGWPKVFPPGPGLFNGLHGIYTSIEAGGNSTGMLRRMYADFLDEAAIVTNRPALTEQATNWRAIADRWTALADAALPAAVPLLAEARILLHRRERAFIERGAAADDEIRAADLRLDEMQHELASDFSLDERQSLALLEDLRDRLLGIHAAEVAGAEALAS